MHLPSTPIVLEEKEEVLGTVVGVTVVLQGEGENNDLEQSVDQAQEAIRAVFRECHRIDQDFSRFRTDNQLSELNSRIGDWTKVSAEMYFLLEKAEEITRKTNGVFYLGIKKILEDWGYDPNYTFQASSEIRESDTSLLAYELRAGNEVKISQPIELGGLGKGYALDHMSAILADFPNVCIDAGGDLYARGMHAAGTPWKVVFEHPLDLTMAIGEVSVDGFFLAASNPLKRNWANYHHLVDPHLKKPANNMLAVYTQAKTGLLADAYSTALFVLGFEKAKELLQHIPVEAMLVSPQGEIYRTEGFEGELFT